MLFSVLQQNFVQLGFGSVFDGDGGLGQFAEISTQAVIDLIKNVDTDSVGIGSHVEISTSDVDKFCIKHPDNFTRQSSRETGEDLICIIKEFIFCVFWNFWAEMIFCFV